MSRRADPVRERAPSSPAADLEHERMVGPARRPGVPLLGRTAEHRDDDEFEELVEEADRLEDSRLEDDEDDDEDDRDGPELTPPPEPRPTPPDAAQSTFARDWSRPAVRRTRRTREDR